MRQSYKGVRFVIAFVAAAVLAPAAIAPRPAQADTPAFSIAVTHVDADPKIDGTLDDPAWQKATHVPLTWDYQFRRAASESTDAYIMADDKYLYVAFVAQQSEPITATMHTNDVTLSADDLVRVYFFPGGPQGFEYGFVSTPIGTRNEFSSENSAFAPHWAAVGKKTATGYIVTEQIPLDVMRGDGRQTWRVQFERVVHTTNQDYEWAHDPAQSSVDSSLYVGYLNGMAAARVAARTKPRVGVYTLGQLGADGAGGTTSHMGADISIPITNTSSFFSTIHPDYSNVDQDQQTISPTAFTRQYQEVRPFFTQGLNFYNNFNCNDCYDVPFLYTPSIPTPRGGYAVEGVQGLAQFGAFDSLGADDREDNAQSIIWQTPDKHLDVNVLRFQTTCPAGCITPSGLDFTGDDDTTISQITYGNHHNESAYITEGGETGSDISDPALAQYHEYGLNLFTSKSGFFPAYHDIGSEYGPVDGLDQDNNLKGPTLYAYKEFDNAPTSYIQSYRVGEDYEHFDNSAGQEDLADAFSQLTVNTRTLYSLQATSGYQYLLLSDHQGIMIDQNGVGLNYGETTNAPTAVTYNIGRYGPGYLRSTTRLTTLHLGVRGTLTLEGDNTDQTTDNGVKDEQWLERASVAYQLPDGSSLAIGTRRIVGITPLLEYPQPQCLAPSPTPLTSCYNNANVSLAYYKHFGQDELYLVYGDPNQLSTYPAFIVKFVHYFGAEKGT
jgi:hypothetical protein